MSELKTYNIAFPKFRVSGQVLHPRLGKKSQQTVCYVDEDLLTLSFRAASQLVAADCEPDAVLFATSSPVFQSRYHASFLTDLLGLKQGILALDVISTARAGTDALLLADKLVNSGQYNTILLIAAHVDFPPAGLEYQHSFGHAAVAMIISKDKGLAEINSSESYSSSLAEEFVYKGVKTNYDARFSRSAGFMTNMTDAWKNTDPKPDQIQHLIINSPYARMALGMVKKSGFDTDKQLLKDSIMPVAGHTGACHGFLQMISAIENCKGSALLFDYQNGTNVIGFSIHKNPDESKLSRLHFTDISCYQDYLALRKQGDFKDDAYQPQEMFSSEMMMEREKDQLMYLNGQECTSCHAVYLIKTIRCHHCKGTDFTVKKLATTGTVYTLTAEHYFPASFPPVHMVVIDLDGGGRITVQQTDNMYHDDENRLNIGDRVELVYRSMMENDKKPNYFWKCVKLAQ
ncbi:OB-fold domain-containing protein [Bacteroidota bacterium]